MPEATIKALVVDDSALYRKFVSSVLQDIPGVEVIGTAINGRAGLEKIASLKPDLITLDMEMPELDGLGLLRGLTDSKLEVATIMISSLTEAGAKTTNEALQLGAFDFVLKPTGKSPDASRDQLKADLAPKINAFVSSRQRRSHIPQSQVSPKSSADAVDRMVRRVSQVFKKPKILGIGISTGGPAALNRMLPKLPANFPCPIVIVQHMPPKFTKSLADDLNRKCKLEVLEAANGMIPKAGQILIAPGGSQMRVLKLNELPRVQITDDPPERNCKPAVDYLFRSLAQSFGDEAMAAVLTGMGDDGTVGCKLMKSKGAMIMVQDEASCVVYGMPRSVFEAGVADQVVPLDRIASSLVTATTRGA
ncbi:MAG: chemotaxis response regulator protein-glutamate methylesterase [Planctomycetes bacterium]|nr:chemotaxis response regulator protein-glutamate methylesterase [Planctomycetota bacterium]